MPKAGYLRFWNLLPQTAGSYELRRAGVTGPDATLARARSYAYSSYLEMPLGKQQLTVVKTGSPETVVRNLVVDLKPETFFTVALMPAGNGVNVEFTEDTIDPNSAATALTIRNSYPGISVSVSANSQRLVESLAYGRTFVARDLPPQTTQLSIETTLPSGQQVTSIAEADFKRGRRATLLVVPDSYGRFRPRVTPDGAN